YRWVKQYERGGLEALRPRSRADRGKARSKVPAEVLDEALRLLAEDDGMTFTFLLAVLSARFPQHTIRRSTLQRRLAAQPEYKRVKRARRRSRRRTRFVAAE